MTNPTKEQELLSCPFCGGTPLLSILNRAGQIYCSRCRVSTRVCFDPFDNNRLFQSLKDAWNTRRASPDIEAVKQEIEKAFSAGQASVHGQNLKYSMSFKDYQQYERNEQSKSDTKANL